MGCSCDVNGVDAWRRGGCGCGVDGVKAWSTAALGEGDTCGRRREHGGVRGRRVGGAGAGEERRRVSARACGGGLERWRLAVRVHGGGVEVWRRREGKAAARRDRVGRRRREGRRETEAGSAGKRHI